MRSPTGLSQVLSRPRLEAALDSVLGHRLALVVADAGMGKTTLTTSWAAGINAAMHDITAADGELPRFARHVLAALRTRIPELPGDLLGAAGSGSDATSDESAQADAMAERLGSALEQHLLRDVPLVLDNVHLLPQGAPTRFLAALVRHAPPLLHIVLAGRTYPPIGVDRLRRDGEVVELHGTNLAFTADEVAALLAAVLGTDAGYLAGTIHEATAGWPAAVRLAIEALREVEPGARERHVGRLVGERGQIFELARVIYEQEPETTKRLLAAAALFDEVTVELLEAIGLAAREPIDALVRRGLFLEGGATGPDWYRLHAIAHEAVAQHGTLEHDEAVRLQVDAATWFAENDLPQAALSALTSTGKHSEVAALLRHAGPRLLRSGYANEVIAAITTLPDGVRDTSLERLAGETHQLRGDWDQALACYARATPAEGPLDPGLAWRMGLMHYLQGDSAAALAVYERGAIGDEPTRDVALLLAWMAAVHWARGEADACGRLAVRALRVATKVDDAQALAAAHTVLSMLAVLEGDPRANDAHYRRAVQHAERAGDVLQLVRIHSNRGSHLVEEGAYLQALDELDEAIRLADMSGFAAFGALALNNRGEALLGLGRFEEAQADLEASANIFDDLGSAMVAYPLHTLGSIHHLRGDYEAARTAFEQALRLAESRDDIQGEIPALAGLARLLADDDPVRATELADRAVERGRDIGSVPALLAAAWVKLARGERIAARREARTAKEKAETRRDRAGLAEALTLEAAATDDDRAALELAEHAAKMADDLGDPVGTAQAALVLAERQAEAAARSTLARVQTRMREIGCRLLDAKATAALAALEPQVPSPRRVETLGRFRVVRDGEVVPASAWQSRKARDLLKILISRRGRAITRDALMELLWPGEAPDEVGNRLNVLLSTIRGLLDPAREAASVIVSDGDAVRLDLDHLHIDVEAFLADAAAGLRLLQEGRVADGIRYLTRAEASYSGDFLEESVYEDWAAPLREEARATYREVATRLASHARDTGNADAATRYLLRILERDPHDERTHLDLVQVLATSGRPGDARRQYRLYCLRMDELGIEAAPFRAA